MHQYADFQHRKMSAPSISPTREPSLTLSDHSDKQHRCGICSKQFSRASILRDHIRRHEKERPFQCSTCDKAFPNKSDLKRHEDSHAGRKFACARCGRQFTRRLAITKHICMQTISNAAYQTIAQSIEHDPSLQYILPSNSDYALRDASKPSQGEPYDARIRHSRPSASSSQRTIPLPGFSASHLFLSEIIEPTSGADDDTDDDANNHENEVRDTSNSDSDSEMSSNASNRANSEALPDWEEYSYRCGICPAQYEHNIPFARHLAHHLEELDLCPYRCNTCKISFAFHEELAKHEIYHQQEQRQPNTSSQLSLPCIWNCGKVFTSGDQCREHIGAKGNARCKFSMSLEGQSRITILQQLKELLAPEAVGLLQAMTKIIGSNMLGYRPRSLDMGWFHQMIGELDAE